MKSGFLHLVTFFTLVTLLFLVYPANITADAAPVLTLKPVTGSPGTNISITGSGFMPSTAGSLWFDTNGNGAKDAGEPAREVSTTAAGGMPNFTRLTAPKAPAGNYQIYCDVPGGSSPEASAGFTIIPDISLNIKTGYTGTNLTISGSGFGAGTSGYLWFDTNGDGKRDTGEPQSAVTAGNTGEIPPGTSLVTPPAGPGQYLIKADIPDGGTVEAFKPFTYTSTLILSPSPVTSNLGSVVMDTVITITVNGGGFIPDAAGQIWFDYNRDGERNADESQMAVTITENGSIPSGITLTTPKLPPCSSYNVLADVPEDGQIDATGIMDVAETATSVKINKHDPYGNIIASRTVTWDWMKSNLPIIGDGKTDYFIQKGTALSDTFEHVWDPQETDLAPDTLLEMGNAQGTDVKDLLELAGGASAGDSILFTSSDNWQIWFDAENIYKPDPRQGKVVLSWWNGLSGGYVPDFYLGMRLYCFAETTNTAGQHLYGDWDMHETMAPSRWQYSPIGPCTSRLSSKYVSEIDIYQPNIYPCDAAGKIKKSFAAGETVYAEGLGLEKNTPYKLWIQPDGVMISPPGDLDLLTGSYVFSDSKDPSGSQETVTADDKGDFAPVAVWTVPSSLTAPVKYDIAADNQSADTAGTFNERDSVSNIGWEGFSAPAAASPDSSTGSAAASDNMVWKIIGILFGAVIVIMIVVMVLLARKRTH